MFPILFLLILLVPIVELYVIVQVAQGIGVLETIGLLILISVVGAWLIRREGVGVVNRIQQRVNQGQVPTDELVDGALIMFAGALMLTPGFVTDCVALLLLFPPTRIVMRGVAVRWFRSRRRRGVATWRVGGFGPGGPFGGPGGKFGGSGGAGGPGFGGPRRPGRVDWERYEREWDDGPGGDDPGDPPALGR